jgi:hypothetical protein
VFGQIKNFIEKNCGFCGQTSKSPRNKAFLTKIDYKKCGQKRGHAVEKCGQKGKL